MPAAKRLLSFEEPLRPFIEQHALLVQQLGRTHADQDRKVFVELHGDRCFGDDQAMIGGLAKLNEKTVMVIWTQKGQDAQENEPERRNFGMPRAEGYRKVLRLMEQAEKKVAVAEPWVWQSRIVF